MAESFIAKLGTDLAIEAAKAVTQLVTNRALKETTLAWGSSDQHEKFKRKLGLMISLLEDLSRLNQSQRTARVDIWLKEVKEAFYMADDVMDEYAYKNLRRKLKLSNPSFVKKLASFDLFFHFRMYSKVQDILSLFDDLHREAKDIGLEQVKLANNANHAVPESRGNNSFNQSRKHASYFNGFVGREDDENILLERLCSPENMGGDGLSTIAIVGMGGLGKTTLARRLFDHEKISGHFTKRIWMCVSENILVERLLSEMLESATSERGGFENTGTIIDNLKENMKGDAKILLVLDDAWSDSRDNWDSIKESLQRIGVLSRSVALITTRSHEVAKSAGVASPHMLKELSSDESWALLKQAVVDKKNPPIPAHQEEVGKRIIEKCCGVPLSIKVIGRLLKSSQPEEWESIEKSELWDLSPEQNQMLPSLMLSFNYLPSRYLKQCFAYFSIFPRRWNVGKRELICLWASQGYLCNYENRNVALEEIGEDYLKILLNLLLFQESEEGLISMHDLVYDLAVHISGSELINDAKSLQQSDGCRHLVFNADEKKITSESHPKNVIRKLRTIRFVGSVAENLLTHATCLRTLFLCRTGITEVPAAIEKLKHLRFLDLSFNPISTLPDSMGKLYQLQTLVLHGCINIKILPEAVNKMVSLRHILTKTPMGVGKGLRQLTSLQSLPPLCLRDDTGWTIDELGDLPDLRDGISLRNLGFIKNKEEARKAGLAGKKKISELSLYWAEGNELRESDEAVLDGLEPHPYISSLHIRDFMGKKFPTWVAKMAVQAEGQRKLVGLSYLTEVKLINCRRCQTLPSLGQLAHLKQLLLHGFDVDCIGQELYGDNDIDTPAVVSFRCLKELVISGFRRLTTWLASSQEAFPVLEKLTVKDCFSLQFLPALLLTSLRTLELRRLSWVESLDIIKCSTDLTSLTLNLLPAVRSLPDELAECKKLQKVIIHHLWRLESLPTGLKYLRSLQVLVVTRCLALTSLPDDLFNGLSSLRDFVITDCPSLRNIPTSLEGCISLEWINIFRCPTVKHPPTDFSMLKRLTMLGACYYPAGHMISLLTVIIEHIPLLERLATTVCRDEQETIQYFSEIGPFLSRLAYLKIFLLYGGPKIKTLPRELELLTQLQGLCIWEFEHLEEIPDWICNLSSLEELTIKDCKNLRELPSKEKLQRLPVLRNLIATNCPMLSKTYAKDKGPEWHNISHLKYIEMD